ncbi:ferritin-like domain-containing protein [Igneacidithiobacillus siniensis]|uniref:ferritin-like domain-containing protein n=1 Tax=Acidithiobacillus TaxID=119977 RepID=UPI00200BA5FF|nr:ferritin-like domain-containing protein [Acidithiobacillus sp. S30A2]
MRPHPRVVGFLGQALNHEFLAVQQYLVQSRLCRLWGWQDWADSFAKESREELEHAGMLSDQLLRSGVAPSAGSLRPSRPGRDLREMLEQDLAIEWSAVELYAEALGFSRRVRDDQAAGLFAQLLEDEQGHLAHLQETIASMTGAAHGG